MRDVGSAACRTLCSRLVRPDHRSRVVGANIGLKLGFRSFVGAGWELACLRASRLSCTRIGMCPRLRMLLAVPRLGRLSDFQYPASHLAGLGSLQLHLAGQVSVDATLSGANKDFEPRACGTLTHRQFTHLDSYTSPVAASRLIPLLAWTTCAGWSRRLASRWIPWTGLVDRRRRP